MTRVWINQPSGLQTYHKLHGKNVLANLDGKDAIVEIYFLDGAVISQQIHRNALSAGWKNHLTK